MKRAGISVLWILGVLLCCSAALGQDTECVDYTQYLKVASTVPGEARYLDRAGDLVYTSAGSVIDVAVDGMPEVVGQIPLPDGDVRGITATADRLYVITSAPDGGGFNGLAIYDLAVPTNPVLKGEVTMPAFMTALKVYGDYAYLRNDQGRLLVVDIADMASPMVLGTIGQNWLDSFDVSGGWLYGVDRVENDVVAVDLSDPTNLQVDYRLPLTDVISIAFGGGYGYFTGPGGTRVLQFTAPDQFTVAADLPGLTRPLTLRGAAAYAYGLPLDVYDLADPVAPALAASIPFVVHDGIWEGMRLLLGVSNAFAEVALGAMPGTPAVTTFDLEATLADMVAGDGYVYAISRMGLQVLDATDCQAPAALGNVLWQGNVKGQALRGDYLFVLFQGQSFGTADLRVFDVSDPAAPSEAATKTLPFALDGLVAVDDFLYSSDSGTLVVINAADPLAPGLLSSLPGAGFGPLVAVDGADMVVADGMMLRHFDVTDPAAPSPTTAVDTGYEGRQVLLSGGTAMFVHAGGVELYDAGSLGAKNLVGHIVMPGISDGAAYDAPYLYLEGSGVFVFDLTDRGAPAPVGALGYVADRLAHLTVVGGCLWGDHYLSGDRGRLVAAPLHCADNGGGGDDPEVVIDIKPGSDVNPVNCENGNGVIPVAILSTDDFDALSVDHTTVRFGPGEASEAHVKKGRGPKAGEVKRHEEDVDGDGDTDLVFHFRRTEAAIACGDTEAWLTGMTWEGDEFTGSDVVCTVPHGSCSDDDDDDGEDDNSRGPRDKSGLAALAPRLGLAPNPFNPQTTIAFVLPEAASARVEVYDLTGRRVAVIADGSFSAGQNRVTWAGTDDGGRRVASGVYFVRLSAPGVELHERAVLLK